MTGRQERIIELVSAATSEQRQRIEVVMHGVLSGELPGEQKSFPDHEGRPGQQGGSLPRGEHEGGKPKPETGGGTVYHGTYKAVLDKILEEGIQPQSTHTFEDDADYYTGERANAVFVSRSFEDAKEWATMAAGNFEDAEEMSPKTEACIFEIQIPKGVQLEYDLVTDFASSRYLKGGIKPDWIKYVIVINAKTGKLRYGTNLEKSAKENYRPVTLLKKTRVYCVVIIRPKKKSPDGEEKGGEGSGYHSPHYGRPDEVGGSRSRDELVGTTTVDGERMAADGAPLPAHIQDTYIPPAWTDVVFNPNPDGDLLVKGKDAAGREQYVYSKKFIANQAAEKFARIKELDEKFDAIFKENEANRNDKDPIVRENANCMKLIMETGIRPGSDADTKAKVAAYGATTLEGRHVVKTDSGAELHFVGKKGVSLVIPVEDQGTIKMLLARATKAGPEGRLFNTDRGSLLDYSHRLDGGKFKTKDFRTYLGTSLAMKEVKKAPAPKTMKEYKKAVKAVATAVAKKLGNTATVALQSYISPVVFSGWRLA